MNGMKSAIEELLRDILFHGFNDGFVEYESAIPELSYAIAF